MQWLRYRHKFADSPGDWEWYFLGINTYEEEHIEEQVRELKQEFEWSEHYRGVEFEVVEDPPLEVIEHEIRCCQEMADTFLVRIERLKARLAQSSKSA